jgi:hypothetical protein
MARAAECVPDRVPVRIVLPIVMGAAVWLGIVAGYHWMGYSIYRSDLKGYIDWSYHLNRHSDYPSHMPGFSAVILLARILSFHVVADTLLAQIVGYLCWAAALVCAGRILKRIAPETELLGLFLFGFFPLIGVSSAADPVADPLAYVCALGAIWCALEKRWQPLAWITAAGLLVHQAFYPFFLALGLVCVLSEGMHWRYFLASGIPFVLYYIAIALQKGDANWILGYHQVAHTPHAGGWPVFDGIAGILLRRTSKDAAKAGLLLSAGLASVLLSAYSGRKKNWLLLTTCLPVLVAFVLSTQNVAWIIFRLSRLLVFPLCWWLSAHPRILSATQKARVYVPSLFLLIASQLAWAYYSLVYFGWR